MNGLTLSPGLAPQILGNNECFEPYTSNIYVRRVLSGEFTVVNQHLLQDLTKLGLWDRDLKNELVNANGSVQVRTPAAASKHTRSLVAARVVGFAVLALRLNLKPRG